MNAKAEAKDFNDTNPPAVLIQRVDIGQTGNPKQSELTTSVEDAYLLAL